jgi:GNAT superfamily N-acetyltransferase
VGGVTNLQNVLGGPSLRPPVRLTGEHDISVFRSSRPPLNEWLVRRALASEAKTARTYVVMIGNRVVAYYTLAVGSIAREGMPSGKPRRNAAGDIPMVVLGRLAVDQAYERQGIGSGLLQDAIQRMLAAAEYVGVRGMLVHAIDEEAGRFYVKYGFLPCLPIGSMTFLLPAETARQTISNQ